MVKLQDHALFIRDLNPGPCAYEVNTLSTGTSLGTNVCLTFYLSILVFLGGSQIQWHSAVTPDPALRNYSCATQRAIWDASHIEARPYWASVSHMQASPIHYTKSPIPDFLFHFYCFVCGLEGCAGIHLAVLGSNSPYFVLGCCSWRCWGCHELLGGQIYSSCYLSGIVLTVPGIKPRIWHMQGKCSSADPHT